MILWQKQASAAWLAAHESDLEAIAGGDLAVISRPGKVRSLVQVVCRRPARAARLHREFGGVARPLPRDWLRKSQAARPPSLDPGRRPSRDCERGKTIFQIRAQTPTPDPGRERVRHRRTCDDGDVAASARRDDEKIVRRLAPARRRDWHRDSGPRRPPTRRERGGWNRHRSSRRQARPRECADESDFARDFSGGRRPGLETWRALRNHHGQSFQRAIDQRAADFSARHPEEWSADHIRHPARAGSSGRSRATLLRVPARDATPARQVGGVTLRTRSLSLEGSALSLPRMKGERPSQLTPTPGTDGALPSSASPRGEAKPS